ncbi:hypothetical protein A3726_11950 [Erythrobacter sp. HI0037]|nr:hypothetical protein A3719_04720 [Erythrobacter sp. HI0020]KZY16341.1 hypothetical protein A3726_11950 [Erythrobacter sp. HI0037]KZY18615.1 hypothetical protein A3727_03260 [Erythrobacter sp. HI0038]
MTGLLIYNSSAGDEDHSGEDLAGLLISWGWPVQLVSSDDDNLEDALRETESPVFVAGGDGTVAKVVIALRSRSVPIAILPTGGSNNIARAFGIIGSLRELAAGLTNARSAPFDIALAEGCWGTRLFVEAAGLGAFTDALCNLDGNADSTKEKLAMGRAALRKQLDDAEACTYALELDGAQTRETLLMLEVLNIPSIGPRLELAPDAAPGDGLLHAVSLSQEQRPAFIHWLDRLDGPPPVTVRACREMRIESGPERIRLDDPKRTTERNGAPVRFSLHPRPATILVPATANCAA